MPTSPVRLGLFALDAPVGQGGMGQVWRAVHVGQDVPVAVKVLTTEFARRRAFVNAFRNEVRASVALDHPSIAAVHDLGVIPREAEAATSGALVAGSPYLVMEYAPDGSLDPRCGRVTWLEARDLLLSLLAALGHAHARGVVHRDVKPGNVLVVGHRVNRPGIRLADFGLAHAHRDDRSDVCEPVAGTPRYMAPEQLDGRWRDQGPWTDLYAVGRLALALLMGDLDAPWVPPPVPRGFSGWVARLLEPHPRDRFRMAADAAFALRRLRGELVDDGAILRSLVGEGMSERTWSGDETRPLEPLPGPGTELGQAVGQARAPVRAVAPAERRLPPMPADPPDLDERPIAHLWGVGLEVFPLRTIPLVGRRAERRQLWSALSRVRAEGRTHVVLLTGPAGTGKSRLARWLVQRAQEAGAAMVLEAGRAASGRPGEELSRMVARHLGCSGLSPELVGERLRNLLADDGVTDPYEAEALAEVIAPSELHGLPARVRFARADERYAVVVRLVRRLARSRPVIVWLEDVHSSPESVAFIEALLGASPPVGALVVATSTHDGGGEGQAQLTILRDRAEIVEVGPLPAAEHEALVRNLLGLDGDLAMRVEERTAGNPQFAVQLVRDWVERGLLVGSSRGFQLRRDARIELPEDLRSAWDARLEALLQGLPDEAAIHLERAAALGDEVDEREWRLVCDDPDASHPHRQDVFSPRGLRIRARLLDRLLGARLAVRTETGWAFAHAMVRETLLLRARAADRLAEHHRACAAWLRGRRRPGVAERLGRHLVEAGEALEGIDAWLQALDEHTDNGDIRAARRLLEKLQRVIAAEALPDADRRWGKLLYHCATLAFLSGDYDEVGPLSERLEEAARAHGWPELRVQALLARARPNIGRGRFVEAIGWCTEAERLAVELGDRGLAGLCRVSVGTALAHRGEVERALEYFEHAREDFVASGDTRHEGSTWRGRATALRQLGRYDEAIECFRTARACLERIGVGYGMYECVNGIGDIQRMMGDLEAAERSYREALAGCEMLGSWHAVVIRVNLALVLIEGTRYVEAYTLLTSCLEQAEARGLAWLAAVVHAACLPCAAAEGDGKAWAEHLERARALLESTAFADADIAHLAEIAGALAADAGRPADAADAYAIAIAQWRATGRPEEAARVKDRLRRL